MSPPLFHLHEGTSRLIINVPHAGMFLPEAIARQLNATGRAVYDTDWHVDLLYDFARAAGATLLVASHARSVVDLNRGPDGAKLYPGQAETGICPTESFDGAPLYAGGVPDDAEIAARIALYWRPYHAALAQQLARVKALHGGVHLLDAHSIRARIPRLFEGTLPDLNFGTNAGAACAPALAARALAATAGRGFSQVLDGRFRGGYITRHYGNPADGVQAIQLELAQSSYMDEAAAEKAWLPAFDPARAARLVAVLGDLVAELQRA